MKETEKTQFPQFDKEQADVLVKTTMEMLGPGVGKELASSGLNVNHLIRFMYIGNLCKNTREERGLSFKEISSQLKIPQYRLKPIEDSYCGSIEVGVLEKYIEFLGLKENFEKWKVENMDVYEEITEKGA